MSSRVQLVMTKLLTTRVAWPLLVSIGLLCTVSILALRMSSPDRAAAQQVHIIVGGLLMAAILLPSYQMIGRFAFPAFGLVCVLLAMVLFTDAHKGGHRWISLSSSYDLQPSELAKITFIIALAWYLRFRKKAQGLRALVGPVVIMALPMGLILIEPDLGTALLFPPVCVAMLIAAGIRMRTLVIAALLVVLLLPGLWFFMKPYQRDRLTTLYQRAHSLVATGNEPTSAQDTQGNFYQQHQSMIAIGSGGGTGLGIEGSDHIRKGILPEAYTDFIFAVVGTQWGFAGCLLVLLLYLAFYGAGMEVAASTRDPFGRLLAIGITTQIVVQALINIAMAVGVGPVVGVALPFISYGGSSVVATMISSGLLLNISMRRDGKLKAATQAAMAVS